MCRLRYGSRLDTPDALLFRGGFLRRRDILVDTSSVAEIIPAEGTLRLNATPGDADLPTVLKERIPSGPSRKDKSAA